MTSWWARSWWDPSARSRGGCLEMPRVAVPDEVTITVLLDHLPDQYFYLGSHGVIPTSILRNLSSIGKFGAPVGLTGCCRTRCAHTAVASTTGATAELSDILSTDEVLTTTRSRGISRDSSRRTCQNPRLCRDTRSFRCRRDRRFRSFPAIRRARRIMCTGGRPVKMPSSSSSCTATRGPKV